MRGRILIVAILVVAVGVTIGVRWLDREFAGVPLTPPTPPLLENARAAGGWWSGGCPPKDEFEKASEEAKSPEVEDRLRMQFPPGTPANLLRSALLLQGFSFIDDCPNDLSIKRATFQQNGGGFFGPYPAFAIVAWKIDGEDRIIWTKGTVAYTGP